MYNQRRREKRQLPRTVKRKRTCNTCLTHACMNNSKLFCPQSNNRRNLSYYFVKKFKVYSTAERSSLLDSPRTLCVVHVYTKQLFVGVRYLELIDCACSLRSLGVASITLCVRTVAFLYPYWLEEGWKLPDHCTSTSETEQNDMKMSSKCLWLRVRRCVKKGEKAIFGTGRFCV